MNPVYTALQSFKGRPIILLAGLLLFITSHSSAQTYTSQSSTTFPNIPSAGRNIVADFDGDGDVDILFQTNTSAGSPFNYARSNHNGTFTIVVQSASPFAGLTLPDANIAGSYRPADYDGDGDIDLWVAANGGTGTYFRNDGSSFSSQSTTGFPNPAAVGRITVADFDGDGDADILFQTGTNTSGFNYARSNGNGTFTTVAQNSSPFSSVTLPDAAQISTYRAADFDGDGDIDLWATANSSTGTYFRNDGSSFSLQPSTTFPAAGFTGRNIIGDFDADGDADILYQTASNTSPFAYARSDGNGSFTTFTQGSSPFAGLTLNDAAVFGNYKPNDFDGDGDIDLWMLADNSSGTYYMLNGSPPTLASTNPANDAAGVLRDANINLTFTESVTKNTGNITIIKASDNSVVETINVTSGQVTGSGTAYVINPSTTLASNTTFSVRIAGGAFLDATSTEFPGISGSQFQFTTGTVLPLLWLSANAVFENGQVNIHWRTTGELNTSHFEIERSVDGAFYKIIGQTASANSAGEHLYTFADKGVQPGYTYFYRLKQVDIDESFNYSSTLQVDIGGERMAVLKISNNPVRSDMVLSITLPQAQNARLILVNQAGATLLERKENLQAGETIMTVRTSNLPTGIYYLILFAGRDKLRTTLIKQ
ncbi:MAG: FG-GAP-like repeat-containing protein [Niastella sp.]|uniref:FG-GAP-like repeat-containing protein n=1 Tax=Niastella sp. TaxID=1869183 RepID=UPI003899F3F1